MSPRWAQPGVSGIRAGRGAQAGCGGAAKDGSRWRRDAAAVVVGEIGTASVTPDVHIWTRSKLPWVVLPDDVPAFEQFYDVREFWPAASLQRLRANIEAHSG